MIALVGPACLAGPQSHSSRMLPQILLDQQNGPLSIFAKNHLDSRVPLVWAGGQIPPGRRDGYSTEHRGRCFAWGAICLAGAE